MLMVEKGEFKKRMFALGSGSLTSFEISFNLQQTDRDPEWASKGELTRNYQSVKWQQKETVLAILDEAKKNIDSAKTYEELKMKIKRWFGETEK